MTNRDDSATITAEIPNWMQRVAAGIVLFKEGDRDGRTFVLLDGRVEILKDGKQLAEIGVSDSFIGEVSALTGKPRYATARTVVPSTMLVVENVSELFATGSSWGLKLARVLAERLDRTNERFLHLQAVIQKRSDDDDESIVETIQLAVADHTREL